MLLIVPFSLVCGQAITRFCVAKSSLPSPVIFVAKLFLALCLIHFLVGSLALASEKHNKDVENDLQTFLIKLLLLCFGLWVGESFRPITLTGSIATGKSTVAQMLLSTSEKNRKRDDDVYLVDSDAIGHEILLPPDILSAPKTAASSINQTKNASKRYTVLPSESVYDRICAAFPEDKGNFLDPVSKTIIRRKLGSVIFSNDQKRRVLNGITHPRIIQILIKQILKGIYIERKSICCADVPLLFESGMLRFLFCIVVVVATNPHIQYQRLRQRNTDLSEEDCRNRIKSQYPVQRKVAGADIVIWNDGSVEDLEKRVQEVKSIVRRRLYGGLSMHICVLLVGLVRLGFCL